MTGVAIKSHFNTRFKFGFLLFFIRSIINHFSPKIDAWSAANHVTSLTEQQVLDIVRNNYESLTLKLEDDLDQYERYSELPGETSYFSSMVCFEFDLEFLFYLF